MLRTQAGRRMLVACGGLLLAASFPPFDLYPLAWGALVPLLEAVRRAPNPRAAWTTGTLGFLVFYLAAGWWGWNHYHLQPALAATAPLLIVPVLLGAPCAGAVFLRRRLGAAAGTAALVGGVTAIEWSLFQGPWALPWLVIGHSQANAFPFNQLADPFGVMGLSLWVWSLNLAVWAGLRIPGAGSTGWAHRWGPPLAGLLVVIGAYAVGTHQMNRYGSDLDPARPQSTSSGPGARTYEILLVQPGLAAPTWTELGAHRAGHLRSLTDSIAGASEFSGARPDLLVWPESTLPAGTSAPTDSIRRRLAKWTAARNAALLTGAIVPARLADPPAPEGGGLLNAALLLDGRETAHRYDKRRLVPFAEQVPGARWWPRLQGLALDADGSRADGSAGYRIGRTAPVLRVGDLRLGPMICFESVFPGPARRAVRSGADILVVLAQSGWWGSTPGYEQHFAFSRLRAIETRRPVAVTTVNGRSGWIRPDGRTAATLGWMERGGLLIRWSRSDRSAQVTLP